MPEQKEEKKIHSPQEIHEMFNPSFLPSLQEFARRVKKERYPAEKIACFQVRMFLEFSDLEAPLTFESLGKKVNLQLQPVLQSDVDKQKADEELQAEENNGMD